MVVDLNKMYHQQQNKWYSQRCSHAHFGAIFLFSAIANLLDHDNINISYYVQLNSLRLKSNVAWKWARKHLWGYGGTIYFAVDGTFHLLINTVEIENTKRVEKRDTDDSRSPTPDWANYFSYIYYNYFLHIIYCLNAHYLHMLECVHFYSKSSKS